MRNLLFLFTLGCLTSCVQTPTVTTSVENIQVGADINLALNREANFSSPRSASWHEIPAYAIELSAAPPVHASVNLRYDSAAPDLPVNFQVASDGERYFLRLRWSDTTDNRDSSRSNFADAVAAQFALGTGENTSFMMGGADSPVNIWYWKAGLADPQNLAAAGFGSTTKLDQEDLQVADLYKKNGEWIVVFSRPMQTNGDYQVDLSEAVHLSLAVWQGETRQRDGLKHVMMGWVTVN
jgi:dimethylsulfide dehydrogenase subunit gamma